MYRTNFIPILLPFFLSSSCLLFFLQYFVHNTRKIHSTNFIFLLKKKKNLYTYLILKNGSHQFHSYVVVFFFFWRSHLILQVIVLHIQSIKFHLLWSWTDFNFFLEVKLKHLVYHILVSILILYFFTLI